MPRGKAADGKPRGRISAYAYFLQACREESKRNNPNEAVKFADFSRNRALRWKGLSDQQKAPFQEQADMDKERFQSEMKKYVPPPADPAGTGKGKRGSKKAKKVKDPNAPKRALSAFFWFCNDERPKIRAAHPELSVGAIAKQLGAMWNAIDPQLKENYGTMADKDKARYAKDMAAYTNRQQQVQAQMQLQLQQQQQDEEEYDDEEDESEEEDYEDDE